MRAANLRVRCLTAVLPSHQSQPVSTIEMYASYSFVLFAFARPTVLLSVRGVWQMLCFLLPSLHLLHTNITTTSLHTQAGII